MIALLIAAVAIGIYIIARLVLRLTSLQAVLAALVVIGLATCDHAMRKDKERLCSNDATAYAECYK